MTSVPQTAGIPPRRVDLARFGGPALTRGLVMSYLTILVLIPIAALTAASVEDGMGSFWDVVTIKESISALKLTLGVSFVVVIINAIAGTTIAWVLVRDEFRGKKVVNSLIDLPFALPTIVAGLVLLALYGDNGVLGLSGVSFTKIGVALALLFVTLPFVIRAVQPTLIELDRDMEEAAASLGATPFTVFRKIVFPNLLPAIVAGSALAFARAVGEFGSLILISGNIPFDTQVSSVFIYGLIETGGVNAAAAVSVVLLTISVSILFFFHLITRWSTRHDV